MSESSNPNRRSFVARGTAALTGALGLVVAIPAVRFLLYPVGRKTVSSAEAPTASLPTDALQKGAPPVQVAVTSELQRDAWSVRKGAPVGSAWVTRADDGSVQAFSATCPHLGCSVGYDTGDKRFVCPCHKSWFNVDGTKGAGPAKRGLDPLPVVEKNGQVVVTLKRFRPDIAEREEV